MCWPAPWDLNTPTPCASGSPVDSATTQSHFRCSSAPTPISSIRGEHDIDTCQQKLRLSWLRLINYIILPLIAKEQNTSSYLTRPIPLLPNVFKQVPAEIDFGTFQPLPNWCLGAVWCSHANFMVWYLKIMGVGPHARSIYKELWGNKILIFRHTPGIVFEAWPRGNPNDLAKRLSQVGADAPSFGPPFRDGLYHPYKL